MARQVTPLQSWSHVIHRSTLTSAHEEGKFDVDPISTYSQGAPSQCNCSRIWKKFTQGWVVICRLKSGAEYHYREMGHMRPAVSTAAK